MTDRLTLVESSLETCPVCGNAVDNLGLHWARWCSFPSLVDEQHELVAGLLLGGAVLRTRSANPSLTITTRHRDLALWTADQLGWLASSVQRVPTDGDGHTYKIQTRTHGRLERYAQWIGDDGHRSPPVSSLRLSRRVVRTWYAYSATAAWHTDHDTRETLFSAKPDHRREWVGRLLERLGFEPSYRHYGWYLSLSETQDLLEWCGGPVPGVEYKWAMRKAVYERLRDEPDRGPAAPDDVSLSFYEPDEYAPAEAEIPRWEPDRDLYQQYSDADCLEALVGVATLLDMDPTDLSIATYENNRWRYGDAPGKTLIADRFGGWTNATTQAELRRDRRRKGVVSRLEAEHALLEVADRVEGPLTYQAYNEHRDDYHPVGNTIVKRFGWNNLKEELGLKTESSVADK